MRNNDQVAIFESYREDILNKFKDSISGENNIENEDLNDTDSGTSDDIDMGDLEDDDTEQKDEAPKRKVVVKSEVLSTNVGPKLREILRNIPEVSEDVDILSLIKKSIEKINSNSESEEDNIKASPLAIYDKLIELNAISEEEMDNDKFEDFNPDKEPDVLQSFEDDDYNEFDDSDEREQQWKKDELRGKWDDIIRDMGTDWRKDEEDFRSSNY
jgi:hypothetical protein